jgi:hypothetical protein
MRDLRQDELSHVYGGLQPKGGSDKKTDKHTDRHTDKHTDKVIKKI